MTTVSTSVTTDEVGFNAKNLPIPAAIAGLVALVALVGGLIVGPGANSIISGVLDYQADSAGQVTDFGSSLPFVSAFSTALWISLTFAFTAGMVATVNPCGFVMLPAFLTMYLSDQQGDQATAASKPVFKRHLIKRLTDIFTKGLARIGLSIVKALYVSLALGAGFVLLFGGVGLAISAGAQSFFVSVFPWVGFILGFVMAGLGAYLFAGGKLYSNRAQSAASHIGSASDTSVKGYFLFGISYGVASLSCTLPIFLAVVGLTFADTSLAEATGQFIAYGLGMTFVITMMTILIAVFKGALVNQIRRAMPYVSSISAGVLIIVGGYLIFYWLTEGEISRNFGL